jgi:signal transduction histidine kinase
MRSRPASGRPDCRSRDLPAVTDLSAYRIIQEALTNAISHAGPATAAVTVRYAADSLAVEVTDTGCGLSSIAETELAAFLADGTGVGHGLRGMRERATAAGGVMEIGPLPDRGFRVAARFPLDAPAQPETALAQPEPGAPAQPETALAQPETAPNPRHWTRDDSAPSGQPGGRR